MKKRVRFERFKIMFSNKTFYTLIFISLIIFFGVIIYAVVPNPGHSASDLEWSKTITNIYTNLLGVGTTKPTALLEIRKSSGLGMNSLNVSGLLYVNDTNVGVGIINPRQKLSVAGIIESTSGGFRFPDGTTQTTAAGSLSCPSCGTCWAVQETQSGCGGCYGTCTTTRRLCTPTGWVIVDADSISNSCD